MSRSTYSLLSEAEKGKITDERNAAVNHYQGIRIGWSKAVYQTEDGVFIMRDYFSKVFNLFGVKQADANQFLVDILKAIQLNENKLLGKQTYAVPAIRAIGKSPLPHCESMSSSRGYWSMEFNFSKQAPYVKLLNIKDDEENNGITCFIKELIILAGFINSKQRLVDDVLFKTNTIKSDLNDKELFQ